MVSARLTVVLLLALAAPAWGGRTWDLPSPLADPLPEYANAAVGPDGTTITAWTVDDGQPGGYSVFARAGSAPAVGVGTTPSEHVEVGAGPGGRGEVLFATTTADGLRTEAVFAAPDGSFSAPVPVGAGQPLALATNAGGDVAVLMQDVSVIDDTNFATHTSTAFAPAGGSFGAAVGLPDTLAGAFSLSPAGETLVGMGLNRQNGPTAGLLVYSRMRDGALGAPTQLTSDGRDTTLAADAHGRVLAVWTLPDRTAYFTAVRGADGTWSPTAAHTLPAQLDAYDVGVDDEGDVVMAWRDVIDPAPAFGSPLAGPLRVATGSLVDRTFSGPDALDAGPGTVPYVRTTADGTTVIASVVLAVKGVRVVRRDGTGPFAAPQTAACDAGVSLRGIAGVTATGDTALLVGGDLIDDHASDPSGKLTCPRPVVTPTPSPTPTRSPTPGLSGVSYSHDPVVAGEPVTITAAAHGDVSDYRFVFRAGGPAAAGATVTHPFPRPGLAHWALTTRQGAADVTDRFTTDVFARPTLRVLRTSRAAVRVRANAFTGAERAPVVLSVRGHGHRLARRTVRLGARPTAVRLRLSPRVRRRTPVRVTLLQDGRRLRTARG